jgi:hypothetical protein
MRKNMLKVALWGAMVAMAAPLVSSCGKDDDKGDDTGTYTPPADLNAAGVVQLVKDANAVMSAAQKYTITSTSTEEVEDVTFPTKLEQQMDREGGKLLAVQYINNLPWYFMYVEGSKRYTFDWSFGSAEDVTSGGGEKSYIVTTLSAANIKNLFDDPSDFIPCPDSSYWTWKVDGAALVGTRTYQTSSSPYPETEVFKITLNANKRFKSIQYTYTEEDGNAKPRTQTLTIAYDANPSFPSDFDRKDFKERESSPSSSSGVAPLWAKRAPARQR